MKQILLTIALCCAAQFSFAQMETSVELIQLEENTVAEADAPAIKAAHSQQALNLLQNYIQNNVEYPEELKAYGEEGVVLLSVGINAFGEIVSTEILESFSSTFSKIVLAQMENCDLSQVLDHEYFGNSMIVLPVEFALR